MRAIDADKLKRKAQECATEAWKMNLTARIETILNQFIDWIDKAPTIEPEIVRCKDCLMHGVCRFEQGLGLNGYCSKAERRTDVNVIT